jgi:hypothetical protein
MSAKWLNGKIHWWPKLFSSEKCSRDYRIDLPWIMGSFCCKISIAEWSFRGKFRCHFVISVWGPTLETMPHTTADPIRCGGLMREHEKGVDILAGFSCDVMGMSQEGWGPTIKTAAIHAGKDRPVEPHALNFMLRHTSDHVIMMGLVHSFSESEEAAFASACLFIFRDSGSTVSFITWYSHDISMQNLSNHTDQTLYSFCGQEVSVLVPCSLPIASFPASFSQRLTQTFQI